ncbi:MAG: type III pantothenate kinase [Bacteroidales bacterium]
MMKKLVIDIGNTLAKIAVFEDKQLMELDSCDAGEPGILLDIIKKYPCPLAILSSVRDYSTEVREYLSARKIFIELDENTRVPVKNTYETPETLGKDRLAAACGAQSLFPGHNVLVVNAGSCITYEVISSSGEYHGGSISPGLMMRFKALHTFTGRLPLLSPATGITVPGKNTHDSIITGALLGAVEEINGMCARYQQLYPELKVVLSGGDISFFENQLKSGIFAVQNIVLLGLNEILDYNV